MKKKLKTTVLLPDRRPHTLVLCLQEDAYKPANMNLPDSVRTRNDTNAYIYIGDDKDCASFSCDTAANSGM